MGRYKDSSILYTYSYPKTLSISFLKNNGYLDGNNKISGCMKWVSGGEETGNIGIEVVSGVMITDDNIGHYKIREKTLRVYFTMTHNETGEKEKFDYTIGLESVSCHFGGVRWYFICPCGGNRCSRLYLQNNGYFASRQTLGLKYEEQNMSKQWRDFHSIFPEEIKASEILETIKYKYRNGQITRKYKRYLKLMRKHISSEKKLSIARNMYDYF